MIPDCVRFLDDVIDLNRYPIEEIDRATKLTRIGLGLMGWHDALMQLGVPYDSGRLSRWPRRSRASSRPNEASLELASLAGLFPGVRRLALRPGPYRNATRTTVAPTGTISIIADCSSGIEPVFALAYTPALPRCGRSGEIDDAA